ncbi:MAG TPA: CSLREA domain-containing protein [Anaerolineales bacterium]|nr:CSLREA domain-containing protein [Anaerolineales bacterium]
MSKTLQSGLKGASLIVLFVCLFAMPASLEAGGGVFIVNTVDDLNDGVCDNSHCSLREAIITVNTNPGTQYIYFDIPGPGPHEIALCSMLPALTDAGTLIDGTTEPDYSSGWPVVVVKPGSPTVAVFPGCFPPPVGLWVQGSDITIRGLSIIGFTSPSSPVAAGIVVHMGTNNTVEQNFIGMDASGAPVGNRDGILIGYAGQIIENNRISGNVTGIHALGDAHQIRSNFIGTDPTGMTTSASLGNEVGILIEPPSTAVEIGGTIPAWGNIISGNDVGVEIRSNGNIILGNRIGVDAAGVSGLGNDTGVLVSGDGNTIEGNQISDSNIGLLLIGYANQVSGNFIGTDLSGDAAIPNDTGIHVIGHENVIGGSIPISVPPGTPSGNIISGNLTGIFLGPFTENNHIYGNKIGAANSADTALPNHTGIELDGADNNTIGSTHLPHEANWVFYNYGDGIRFITTASGNLITGNYIAFNERGITAGATTGISIANTFEHNSIYTNDFLGIDLFPWDVTPNDPGDADIGANDLLNFPEITSASQTVVEGSACPGCIVEIFESDDDPSDHGEGISPIGEGTASSAGEFSIDIDYIHGITYCDKITATNTDSVGNTSEFALNALVSPCFTITPPYLILVGLLFVIGGGLAGRSIGRGRNRSPAGSAASGAAAGALIGAGLIAASSLFPPVQLHLGDTSPPRSEPSSVLPSCSIFLDPDQFAPPDAAVMEDVSFNLEWGWAADPAQSTIRWIVELQGVRETAMSHTTEGFSLPFATFELSPAAGSHFQWRLIGEQEPTGGQGWEVFCEPSPWLSFQIGSLPPLNIPPWPTEQEQEPTPTDTPTPAPPATVDMCTYVALANTFCRASDYVESEEIAILLQGEMAEILAINPEFTHGRFLVPSQQHCWIWLGLMDGPQNPVEACGVPVIDPPTPTPPACSSNLDQEMCEASGGTWHGGGVTAAPYCECPG